MTKNKIYLVSFEYFPISQGGLARHAKAIIDRLLKYKSYKAIIAIPKNNKIRLQKDIIAIPCTYFGNKYLCYLEFSLKVFIKFKNRFNIDSFVIFSLFSYFLVPILPKNFYLFVHSNAKKAFFANYPGETFKEKLIRKFIYFINYNWEHFLCIKTKLIFAVSESLKNETYYQYKINKIKIVTINNGVDTLIFNKVSKKTIQTKNLLYVGKLIPRKNLIDLIKIFSLINKNEPGFRLHIMGNGQRRYIDKIKSLTILLNLEKKVFFHKYISDYYLNKLYEKSDILVSTSLVEGFGLVLLEAMSKGLPVVAYENLGFSDIIINGENGYLIKQNDYDNFVNKILYLFKNKKVHQKMSKNALKRIDNFSWNMPVQTLINKIQ